MALRPSTTTVSVPQVASIFIGAPNEDETCACGQCSPDWTVAIQMVGATLEVEAPFETLVVLASSILRSLTDADAQAVAQALDGLSGWTFQGSGGEEQDLMDPGG